MPVLFNRLKALDDLQALARKCVADLQANQRQFCAVAEDGTVMASARGSLLMSLRQADILHEYRETARRLPADRGLAKAVLLEAIDAMDR